MKIKLFTAFALSLLLLLFGCEMNEEINTGITSSETGVEETVSTVEGTEHVHEFGEWRITKEATCINTGAKERKCACGEVEKQRIHSLGHIEQIAERIEPTCDTDGRESGKYCPRCDRMYVEAKVIPAKGHVYSPWIKTETEHERTCSVCNKTEKSAHTLAANGGFCAACKMVFTDYVIPTPEAGMKYKLESLGSLTGTIYIRMNDGGYRKDGTPVLYFVNDGKPCALFVMMDALTGEILLERELTKSTGAWEVFVHSSEDVYIVGHGSPYFYKFDHDTEKIKNIAALPHGSSMGQVMCETKDGRLFSGSTDTGRFWGYDPSLDRFITIPALISNATRYPAVAYDPVEDMLYVSVISRDSKNYLFKVDPNTKEFTDITPEGYRNKSTYQFYDMKVYGDILFIRYPSTLETLFVNIRTGEIVNFNKEGQTGAKGLMKTYARQPAAVPGDPTCFYTIMDSKIAVFDTKTLTYRLTETNAPNSGTIRMVMLKLNSDKYTGYSACSIYSHKGKVQFSNLDTHESVILDTKVTASVNDVNCLTVTDSGKLIAGGNYGGSTGIYDIATGEKELYEGISQQEGIMAYGDLVFAGSYPEARIRIIDMRKSAWNHEMILHMFKNPNISGYDNQDRPYTFLPIYEEGIMAVATVPAQNFTTGALALIDVETREILYYDKFPVQHQSAVSLAYSDGKLFMGTTVRPGYGTSAKASQAVLVEMDIGKKTFKTHALPNTSGCVTAMVTDGEGKIWGMSYNMMFCFDPSTSKYIYTQKQDIPCANATWRDLKMSLGGDGSCILISSSSSRDFYRFDLDTKKLTVLAENVGWHHVGDAFGNFYFISGTRVNKLSFEY